MVSESQPGLIPRTHVIHNPERMDRLRVVANLQDLFPNLRWQRAISTPWEGDPVNAAVRGCSLSHLEALCGPHEDVLVLEDDATVIPAYWDLWKDTLSAHIPAEADIVVLGGETERCSDSDSWGFRVVMPPFWGSHAILYRKSALDKGFLFQAYKVMAEQKIGQPNGICYESVIIQAAQRSGCLIVRPSHIPFTTCSSFSDRSREVDPPRDRWLVMPMVRQVAPSMCMKLQDDLWVALNTRCGSTSLKALHSDDSDPHKAVGWQENPGILEKDPETKNLLMVVRDPVERFKSTVKWMDGKDHPHLPNLGLDVDAWIERIEFEFKTCDPELQDEHIRKQCDHAALRKVTEMVMLEDLDSYLRDKGIKVSKRAKTEPTIDLTPEQEAKVKTLYARDYEMLSMLEFETQRHKNHATSTEHLSTGALSSGQAAPNEAVLSGLHQTGL